MAGTYIAGEIKKEPGVYHRVLTGNPAEISDAIVGIGAGIIRGNWGPLNEVVKLESAENVEHIFGKGGTQDLITMMFNGGIISGYFVRIGSGGTAPTISLKDSSSQAAATITGKYVGARSFTVTVRDSLSGADREIIIYDGDTQFVKATFAKGDDEVTAMVAALNAATSDFAAAIVKAGATLEDVAQSEFAAGTNPTTATADYSTGLTALEPYIWNGVCVDTEETAVHAIVSSYLDRIYANGYYPMAVLAEKGSVAKTTRMAHAAAFNSEKIVYVANPALDFSGNMVDGYQEAAYIGGIIFSAACNDGITHAKLPYFSDVSEKWTPTEKSVGLENGCLIIDTNMNGDVVWIVQGITTLITPDADHDDGWKKIRRVKTRFELMQRIDNTLEEMAGQVDMDEDGIRAQLSAANSVRNAMVSERKIGSATTIAQDTSFSTSDGIRMKIDVYDIDNIEHTYLDYNFRSNSYNTNE